ncbi:P2X receptor A [Diplonema papillatum]|nr:P2X receptor A [Diplonema papillatum]
MGKGGHQAAGSGRLPCDLDDLLAFPTYRTVRIRDRRLGIANILIQLAIFGYVIIYELIIEQGYLLKDEPQGAIATTIRRSTEYSKTLPTYCGDGGDAPDQGKLQCLWIDETDVLYPAGEEYSLFISTRISVFSEDVTQACQLPVYTQTVVGAANDIELIGTDNSVCAKPEPFSTLNDRFSRNYLVGDVERFTLQCSHAVYGPETQSVHHSSDLSFAEMEIPDEDSIEFVPRNVGSLDDNGYIGLDSGDVFTVAVLMRAAGISSLDQIARTSEDVDCSAASSGTSRCPSGCFWTGPICTAGTQAACIDPNYEGGRCEWDGTACAPKPAPPAGPSFCQKSTLRYDGGVFIVMLDYETPDLTISDMGYKYKVRWIPKGEFKVVEKRIQGDTVTYLNRHGIRLVFIPTGFIAKFSFQQMLMTIVTGLALFAAAKIVVEMLVMRLLPLKHVYENYKYTTSKDFSNIHVTEEDPLGGITSEDFVYGMLPPGKVVTKNTIQEEDDLDDAEMREIKAQRRKEKEAGIDHSPEPYPEAAV